MKRPTKKCTVTLFVLFFLMRANFHHGSEAVWSQETLAMDSLAYLTGYNETQWKFTLRAPFQVSAFSGDIEKGIVAIGGFNNQQVAILKDISGGRWEFIAEAPFPVHRCSGDNVFGPLICGGSDRRQVSYMRNYTDNIWKVVANAPFSVTDIAGDNEYGPIVAGGENGKKVAYMRTYEANKWNMVADAPFEVTSIAGTNYKGILIAGGKDNRQVAVMKNYTENTWKIIAEAPFPVNDIAGTNEYGPVVIGGHKNQQIAYMDNYTENRWKVIMDAPIQAFYITGSNAKGILVGGKGRGVIKTVVKKVYKTAVVEFTERGDLGIPDAGAIVAEWITTALNKTGAFEVYERLSLSTLMEEHKLGMSGLMDETTIAEIGRIRGVQAIITGSVIKFGDIISVTAKVIDVETAKIMRSADIKVNHINAISSEIDRLALELAKE